MSASRRWLAFFGIAIGIVVVVAVSVAVFNKDNITLLPEDTPQGTVQRYLIAIQSKDYHKAYSYYSHDAAASEAAQEIDYNNWLSQMVPSTYINDSGWKAKLGPVNEINDIATVQVIMDIAMSNGLFGGSSYSQTYSFNLSKVNNSWVITSGNYSFDVPGIL